MITKSTTYIGFGEWIGPTVFFAAKYALRSYGLEPDPKAFAALQQNKRLNPELSVHISPLCIGVRNEKMAMSGNGDSMSVINQLTNSSHGDNSIQVSCSGY